MNKQRTSDKEREAAYKRDSKLVREVLSGNTSAFAELMSLYKKRVEALGMSFFKNPADTEDFAQDVFLKAYTKLDSFRGESLFSTWLTRMAYNTAINAVNRRAEYVSIADESLLPDNGLTPEEKELRLLTMETVRESLKELPDKYKIVLDLYFFYDNSYSEISEITSLAENTVKSHIFRAKKLLRDKILAKGLVEHEEL
ncbi:MAG: sigma-70 family RNA polymerase sigma factor [Treponema sp.]|nr:sigma-70 family RNA polymerase sigma factor [Treponema sp.]MBR5965874.1 sigma-70 family RNA polymerase sigma factor [Treponema sp.]